MKKMLALLLIGLAATSFAEIRVDWYVNNGFYFTNNAANGAAFDPGYGMLGPDGSGKGTWMQLVSVGVDGKRDWAGAALNTFYSGTNSSGVWQAGDDVVLASFNYVEDGIVANDGDNYMTYAYGGLQSYVNATFSATPVYARIFQDGTPNVGDWYAFTEILTPLNLVGTDFPQSLSLAPTTTLGIDDLATKLDPTTNSGIAGNAQVVPEPATLLLFGIGGMGAWLLRRRQQA